MEKKKKEMESEETESCQKIWTVSPLTMQSRNSLDFAVNAATKTSHWLNYDTFFIRFVFFTPHQRLLSDNLICQTK